jgi:phosphate transport system permease protein
MATTETPTTPTLDPPRSRRSARRLALTEQAAYWVFSGLALVALVVIVLVMWFVVSHAWPAFRANGIGIFGWGSSTDGDIAQAIKGQTTRFAMWPAIYGTVLTTMGALVLALPFSIFSAIFIAHLAPRHLTRSLEPTVRLLAGVPSVIFGLLAYFALAPLLANLIPNHIQAALAPIVPIGGRNVLLGVLVLFAMVCPLMIAIFVDSLRAVPGRWREGSYALGVDEWRTIVRISLPVIRPAIVAGTVLAAGRAIGEAIALSMAAGGIGFSPNPLDGFWALFEPTHPMAAVLVDSAEGLSSQQLAQDMFAVATVILISAIALSIGARLALLPFKVESTRA